MDEIAEAVARMKRYVSEEPALTLWLSDRAWEGLARAALDQELVEIPDDRLLTGAEIGRNARIIRRRAGVPPVALTGAEQRVLDGLCRIEGWADPAVVRRLLDERWRPAPGGTRDLLDRLVEKGLAEKRQLGATATFRARQ